MISMLCRRPDRSFAGHWKSKILYLWQLSIFDAESSCLTSLALSRVGSFLGQKSERWEWEGQKGDGKRQEGNRRKRGNGHRSGDRAGETDAAPVQTCPPAVMVLL